MTRRTLLLIVEECRDKNLTHFESEVTDTESRQHGHTVTGSVRIDYQSLPGAAGQLDNIF